MSRIKLSLLVLCSALLLSACATTSPKHEPPQKTVQKNIEATQEVKQLRKDIENETMWLDEHVKDISRI